MGQRRYNVVQPTTTVSQRYNRISTLGQRSHAIWDITTSEVHVCFISNAIIGLSFSVISFWILKHGSDIYSTVKETYILFFCFPSLKLIMFYFVLSKQIFFVWMLVCSIFLPLYAINRKHIVIFVKKDENYKSFAKCVTNPIFNKILLHVTAARCNKLENVIKHSRIWHSVWCNFIAHAKICTFQSFSKILKFVEINNLSVGRIRHYNK